MVKILVADDSAFSRLNCEKALKPTGYDIVEAENGTDAVELFQSSGPDAVLLDITMPGMDGISALKEILEIDLTARVAMISARGATGGCNRSIEIWIQRLRRKAF